MREESPDDPRGTATTMLEEPSSSQTEPDAATTLPPSPLTPRSKVRAMLAAFDDASSSDDGNNHGGASDKGQRQKHASSTSASEARPKSLDVWKTASGTRLGADAQSNGDAALDGDDDSDDSEEEDIAERPRGRLAQRMFGNSFTGGKKEKKNDVNEEDEVDDEEHAKTAHAPQPDKVSSFERVKRQPPVTVPSGKHAVAADCASDSEDDDEDSIRPAPSRLARNKRLLARSRRSPKPAPQARSAGASSPSPPALPAQVSRPATAADERGDDPSDSDLPDDLHADAGFLASVAQLQREKQAEKAAAAAAAAAALAQQEEEGQGELAQAPPDSDSAVETRLTQQARPTRKASKKALEEMARETQRMARNMHLQHEARTKKKITKQSLFERFNFRPAAAATAAATTTTATTTTSSDLPPPAPDAVRQSRAIDPNPATSSTVVSDADNPRSSTTAPSSPPSFSRGSSSPRQQSSKLENTADTATAQADDVPMDEDLPSLDDVMAGGLLPTGDRARPTTTSSSSAAAKNLVAVISGQRPQTNSDDRANSGTMRPTTTTTTAAVAAAAAVTKSRAGGSAKHTLNRAALRQRLSASAAARRQQKHVASSDDEDDDSELEIVPVSKAKAVLSEHAPLAKEAEPPSLHVLRACAQLNAPEVTPSAGTTAGTTAAAAGKAAAAAGGKATMSFAALQAALRQQARQQAARERQVRMGELKSRGVVLQTAEERAQDEATIEELLDRARGEAERLRKKERAAAGGGAKDGDKDILDDSSDDDDDGDYEGDADDDDEDNADDVQDVEPYVSEADDSEDDDAGEEEGLVYEEAEEVSSEEDQEDPALSNDDGIFDHGDKGPLGSDVDGSDVAADQRPSDSPSRDKKHEGTGEELRDHANHRSIRPNITTPVRRRRRRTDRIVADDDDDDDNNGDEGNAAHQATPAPTVQVPESVRKPLIPGLPVSKGPLLSLTQMFAPTMPGNSQVLQEEHDDSAEAAAGLSTAAAAESRLNFLLGAPVVSSLSESAVFPTADNDDQTRNFIADSQPAQRGRDDGGGFGGGAIRESWGTVRVQATQEGDEEGLDDRMSRPTQKSDFPELTQDVGLSEARFIPANVYRNPASTVDTVLLGGGSEPAGGPPPTSPSARKSRLLRGLRNRSASPAGDADEAEAPGEAAGAFDVMLQAAAKQSAAADAKPFNKKTSRVKELVDEIAEESEDEYAGLGGASDDDGGSDGERSDISNLLDDEAPDVREEDLVALMADRDRAEDKKQLERIFNDVTTGAFRRKRGADFDLSDSDDGEEARRIMKRRKEMRLRRALLADEKLEKIATNPKKSAFFRSIEDHDADDDDEGLDFYGGASQPLPDSQRSSEVAGAAGVHAIGTENADVSIKAGLKRKHASAWPGENENQQPAPRHPKRRAAAGSGGRRRSISELRQTLSDLVAPPNAMLPTTTADYGTSDDNNDDNDDDDDDYDVIGEDGDVRGSTKGETAPRGNGSCRVIDRLSAMRNVHQHNNNSNRAYHHSAAAVRTTTTRLAFATTTTSSTTTAAAPADEDLFLRLPPSFRRASAQPAALIASRSSSSSMHVTSGASTSVGGAYGGIAAAPATTAATSAATGSGSGPRTVSRHVSGAVVAVPRKKGKMKMASISAFAVRSSR